jgi:hypothetical protein
MNTSDSRDIETRIDTVLEWVSRALDEAAHKSARASLPPEIVPPSMAYTELSARKGAPTPLEALANRDAQITNDLMRLQRSLSRQTFRGAESARRLVRRLARRAQQNADEARSLAANEAHAADQVCNLEALRDHLLHLRDMSRGNVSPATPSHRLDIHSS